MLDAEFDHCATRPCARICLSVRNDAEELGPGRSDRRLTDHLDRVADSDPIQRQVVKRRHSDIFIDS